MYHNNIRQLLVHTINGPTKGMIYLTTLRFVRIVRKKGQNLKYGKWIAKKAKDNPWDISLVDIIVLYNIRRYSHD